MKTLFILSPLSQFEVTSLIGLNAPILGHLNLTLTNLGLYSLLVLFVVLGFHYWGNNDSKLIPSKWSISLESSYASLSSMVREQIGAQSEIYLPFVYSLFFFILIGNLISNVPYSFAVTASGVVSLGLSFTIFCGVTIIGLYTHKLHFFSLFVPAGCPLALVPLLVLIETVSYLARAVSLGVRLFANIVSGHTLLKIISTYLYKLFTGNLIVAVIALIPFIIFVALIGLELAVSIIQAYVFTLLVCSYLKDSLNLHSSPNQNFNNLTYLKNEVKGILKLMINFIKQFNSKLELFLIFVTFSRFTNLLIGAFYLAFIIFYLILNLNNLVDIGGNLIDYIKVTGCDNLPIKDECIPTVESLNHIANDKSESESKNDLNHNNDEFNLFSYKKVIIATAVILIIVAIYIYIKPKGGNNDDWETTSNDSLNSIDSTYSNVISNNSVDSNLTAATYGGSSSNSNIISSAAENTKVEGVIQAVYSNLLEKINIQNCYSLRSFLGSFRTESIEDLNIFRNALFNKNVDILTNFKDKICQDINFDLVLIDYMRFASINKQIDLELLMNIFTSEKLLHLFSNNYPHTEYYSLI